MTLYRKIRCRNLGKFMTLKRRVCSIDTMYVNLTSDSISLYKHPLTFNFLYDKDSKDIHKRVLFKRLIANI